MIRSFVVLAVLFVTLITLFFTVFKVPNWELVEEKKVENVEYHIITNRLDDGDTIKLPLLMYRGKLNYPGNPSFISFNKIMNKIISEDDFTAKRYYELL